MKTHSVLRIATVGLVALLPPVAARAQGDPAQTDLRRMTQELLDALAPGNLDPWQRYLDKGFVHMDENGVVRDREALLKEIQPLPAGLVGRIEIDAFQAAIHGNTAVTAYEIQEYLDYFGQPLRSRFRSVDTWLLSAGEWKLVAEHTAAVLKDPPAVRLPRETLDEYEGVYALTDEIQATIRVTDEYLTAERKDRPVVKYSAEFRDVFFAPGQPRIRRIFTRDGEGRVNGFVDRREGEDVRWKRTNGR